MTRTAERSADGFRRTRALLATAALMLAALPASSSAQVGAPALPAGTGLGAGPLWDGLAAPATASHARQAASGFLLGGAHAPARPGDVTLDGSPGFPPVANPATDTVYVPIQCQDPTSPDSCNLTASHVLDLIDSATCNASRTSSCHIVATAAAGSEPITAVMDARTDTVYVGDALGGGAGGGAVTVVNGATCNVSATQGCATPVATIKLGAAFPAALALDPATGTLYVASPTGVVDVLDVSRCSAMSSDSCGAAVKSIADGLGPVGVAVDIATDTVYAANGANEANSNTVSVIDGATCNAVQSAGCAQTPPSVTVGTSPQWDVVDQATNTIYVADALSGSVALIDGATCNATVTSGCGQTPPSVLTGTGDNYLALDASRHTLFSLNQDNDTLSELNVRACNARHPSRCPVEARNEQVRFNPPNGGPANSFALVPAVGTAYVVNAGGESLLQIVGISACNAQDTTGCRVEAPHVAHEEFFPVVDAASHTVYAANARLAQIDVFNAATCRAGHLSACSPVAEIPTAGPQANLDAIDDATHTLYAGNVVTDLAFDPGSTISVIDIAHCNASDTTGCHAPAPTVTVGPLPGAPVLNAVTHTLYDEYGNDEDHLAVIDTRHCNAQDSSGCDQRPASIALPAGANLTALSQRTDTIYQPSFTTHTVAVINGATCNGSDHVGCGHIAALIKVGSAPDGVVVNDATDTAYVGNGSDNQTPGSVSIIDVRACNATSPHGCDHDWPTVMVGRQPQQLALDPASGDVYVADAGSAAISVIDGRACNAATTVGCVEPAPAIPTSGGPGTLAIDPQTDTVFTDESIGFPICCDGSATFGVFDGAP